MRVILVLIFLSMTTSCAGTLLEKARTGKAVLVVNRDFDTVYNSVTSLDLTEAQVKNVNTISSAKQALDLVMDGSNLLNRLETASLLEKHYELSKKAYIDLRVSVDLSKFSPEQRYELKLFNDSLVVLSNQISQMSESEDFNSKKDVVKDVLEMLIVALQIVELTK